MTSRAQFHSYGPRMTSINYAWPAGITGLERIALSAQGDLQRVLSAYFARPITIALIYSDTYTTIPPPSPSSNHSPTPSLSQQFVSPSSPPAFFPTTHFRISSTPATTTITTNSTSSTPYHPTQPLTLTPLTLPNPSAISNASPTIPLIQTRQVHLLCAGKIVCTATSTVKISSPRCAHLFLEEKYAIGQMFTELGRVPAFELLDVGLRFGKDSGVVGPGCGGEKGGNGGGAGAGRSTFVLGSRDEELWRKYRLAVPDFECEILEVFPSRAMFADGEAWLAGTMDYGRGRRLLRIGRYEWKIPEGHVLWLELVILVLCSYIVYLRGF
ncbi:hypothetical protein AX16_008294 [Volvariella volvacea WC 439]|nr:hypothetical protein AX16_008294 [Volvariella volvacea WC 439]